MFYRFHFKEKFKKYFTKVIATIIIVLSLSFGVLPTTSAFAQTDTANQQLNRTPDTPDCAIIPSNDGSISVKSKNEESTIKVHETYDTRTVIVVNEKSGGSNRFVLNKKSGTIFSTYTGKTMQLNDYDQQASQKVLKHSRVKRAARNDCGKKYISWRQVRNGVGASAKTADVAGFVIGIAPQARGAGFLLSAIAKALEGIGFVIPDDEHHGIVLDFSQGPTCRQAGRVTICGRPNCSFRGIGTY